MTKEVGLDLLKLKHDVNTKRAKRSINGPGTIIAGALDKYNTDNAQSRRGRRPSGQEMAFDGLTSGLSTGLKIAESSDFVKKLQAIDASLSERLNYYDNRRKQKEAAEPFVLPAMEVMNSDMPYEQASPLLQQQFSSAQANGVPGLEGFSYAGFIPNSAIVLGTKDGKTVPIDMSRFIDPEVAKGIISNGISRGTLQEKRRRNDMESDPNSPLGKKAASYSKQVEFNTSPEEMARAAGLQARAKKNAEKVMEFEDKLHIADASVANLTELMKVMSKSGLQGSSTVQAAARYLAAKTGETYSIDSVKMLLQSEFASLSDVVGPGVKSDSDMKRFDETLTRLETHPEAAMNMLNARIKLAQNKTNEYRRKLELYAQDPTANLNSTVNYSAGIYNQPQQQENISPEKPLNLSPAEQQAAGKTNMPPRNEAKIEQFLKDGARWMQDPKSGEKKLVPHNEQQDALSLGVEFVD